MKQPKLPPPAVRLARAAAGGRSTLMRHGPEHFRRLRARVKVSGWAARAAKAGTID